MISAGASLAGSMAGRGGDAHPELDQLASESMGFSFHYTEPPARPRGSPRTGRDPVRTGVTDVLWPGGTAGLPAQERTIAELLSDAGYSTAMWGKWHL